MPGLKCRFGPTKHASFVASRATLVYAKHLLHCKIGSYLQSAACGRAVVGPFAERACRWTVQPSCRRPRKIARDERLWTGVPIAAARARAHLRRPAEKGTGERAERERPRLPAEPVGAHEDAGQRHRVAGMNRLRSRPGNGRARAEAVALMRGRPVVDRLVFARICAKEGT